MVCNFFRFSLLAMGILGSLPANGQSYNFINYKVEDGLVHDKVEDICEDQYGNLWIATSGGGISRFNGLEFKNITIKDGLASNYVRAILIDRKNRLWAATAAGISIYDGSEFTHFRIDLKEENNSVNTLYEDHEGNIWFASFGGYLGRINTDTDVLEFYNFPQKSSHDNIISINQDSEGNMWLVSSVQGLIRLKDGKFEVVLHNSDVGGFILTLDNSQDTLWLGTNRGVYFKAIADPDGKAGFLPALNAMFIKDLQVIKRNNIWAVSSSGICNLRDGVVRFFSGKEGFTDMIVNVCFRDREGNLWFGTDGDGLYQLNNELFVHYDQRHGLSDAPITCVVKDREENYWFGTYGSGLQKFDGKNFLNYDRDDGITNTYISSSLKDEEGNLWFGLYSGGLLVYDGQNFKSLDNAAGFRLEAVRCLFLDSSGRIWIGASDGLAMYDHGEFTYFSEDNGLYDNIIWNISEPTQGRILIVTRHGFNYYLNDQLVKGYYHPEVFDKRINTAVQDSLGNFWIGYSGHGILKIHEKTGDFEYITDEQGLNSNLIYNLLWDDKSHDLIVGTERGVARLNLDKNFELQSIKNYQQREGFEELQTMANATFKEDDGSIWFGTSRGAFKYQPDRYDMNSAEPIVYISGVKLSYNDVNWHEYTDSVSAWFNVPLDLELSYKQNNLMINYFGNSLKNPSEVRYKFRLVGFEDSWSPVTEHSEAAYPNLSPGEYKFEVMAANSDGTWSENPAVFEFTIIPPFWQRPWFFILLIIYGIVMLTLYNNFRVRSNLNKILTIEKIRQEEMAKVRKRMARDFHDNMGNQLASITMFTNLISLKLKKRSDEIDQLLQNIEKHTGSLFTGTKDFIWSIDPESDELNKVFTYIRDFGEELYENTNLAFYSEVKGEFPEEASLPSGWSRQIVLIFKEAMTNALKHSRGDEVHYQLGFNATGFVMSLRDNGQGMKENPSSNSYGLKNMKSRAEQIGCLLKIVSADKCSGTMVVFESPHENGKNKNNYFNKTGQL